MQYFDITKHTINFYPDRQSCNVPFYFLSVDWLHRSGILDAEAITSYPTQNINNPPDMSGWNPFGEDNFSKLTEEELLDREFDLLRSSKGHLKAYFASQ